MRTSQTLRKWWQRGGNAGAHAFFSGKARTRTQRDAKCDGYRCVVYTIYKLPLPCLFSPAFIHLFLEIMIFVDDVFNNFFAYSNP